MFTNIEQALEVYKEKVRENLRRNFRRIALMHKKPSRNQSIKDMARVLGLTLQERENIKQEIMLEFEDTPAFKEIVSEGHLKLGKSRKQMTDLYDSINHLVMIT